VIERWDELSGKPGTDYWAYLRSVDALLSEFSARVQVVVEEHSLWVELPPQLWASCFSDLDRRAGSGL
jgi:hypothetical protein